MMPAMAPARAAAAAAAPAIALALGMSAPVAHAAPILDPFGLEGRRVTSLGIYDGLYAGTTGDGVFRRDVSDPQAIWVKLGLQDKRIRAVYPHQLGPVGRAVMVGLEGDPTHPDSALVYCWHGDLPWVEADSGMTRADVTVVSSLDGFPSPAICGETFATSIGPVGGVWRRGFNGTRWEVVLDIGFGVGNVVRADPMSGNVWAGGETSLFSPWIARSTDAGTTWQIAFPDLAGDNACDAIAFHPFDPDIAYAGMEGAVIKTTNGGTTWEPTGLSGTQAYTYGVALDAATPAHILAGGTITNPNSWALWESFDAGATWSEVSPPAASAAVVTAGISSLIADPARPGTFYIATFGNGVWRYRSLPTSIDPGPLPGPFPAAPPALALGPNYPNPFNASTTLQFDIPQHLDGASVQVAIYSPRGDLLRVLVNEALPAGPYRAIWNGEDSSRRPLASGVYYCSLQAGSQRQTRPVVLLK